MAQRIGYRPARGPLCGSTCGHPTREWTENSLLNERKEGTTPVLLIMPRQLPRPARGLGPGEMKGRRSVRDAVSNRDAADALVRSCRRCRQVMGVDGGSGFHLARLRPGERGDQDADIDTNHYCGEYLCSGHRSSRRFPFHGAMARSAAEANESAGFLPSTVHSA